ncbi:MAG: GNAT family N-acetyltransferase [Micavibrio aeruginosavorus]|uniref:GNAT family N-acetyltransferase n=1 Tax=Micavibrio aeruginosavorus TaxID=349221 RepID=A0A2W5PT26_9BACT|nr:MAG: GNAT family N-acetyltransferase [Micavibrio aeruginosavorus]
MSKIYIREAKEDDAQEIAKVICASIIDLCVDDHRNDESILEDWLSNKNAETVKGWVSSNPGGILVGELSDKIVSVGGVLPDGYITLNYIHPDFRFMGISKNMLMKLEERIMSLNLKTATLTSTQTAHSFYRSQGFIDSAPPTVGFGNKASYPMNKNVSTDR